ncbi:MAG: peptidoglycan editing factor PgeF [Cyanobacteria bacterium P01_D01_bin.105]
MELWIWKSWQDKPFLTCTLLPLPHGFFTRQFHPMPPETLVTALSDSAAVFRVKQVHSAEVLLPSEITAQLETGLPQLPDGNSAAFPLADGVVTEVANQSVWACSADCTPALICDVETGRGTAVHAGWRGTAQKILPMALSRMMAQGSALKNLRIALGPAIEGLVYQVDENVACEVGMTVAPMADSRALIDRLLEMENPPLFSDPEEGKVRLDVRRINQMQAEQMGVAAEQIAIAPHCTYQEPDNFFSYRRTQEKNVQWAGIVSV